MVCFKGQKISKPRCVKVTHAHGPIDAVGCALNGRELCDPPTMPRCSISAVLYTKAIWPPASGDHKRVLTRGDNQEASGSALCKAAGEHPMWRSPRGRGKRDRATQGSGRTTTQRTSRSTCSRQPGASSLEPGPATGSPKHTAGPRRTPLPTQPLSGGVAAGGRRSHSHPANVPHLERVSTCQMAMPGMHAPRGCVTRVQGGAVVGARDGALG